MSKSAALVAWDGGERWRGARPIVVGGGCTAPSSWVRAEIGWLPVKVDTEVRVPERTLRTLRGWLRGGERPPPPRLRSGECRRLVWVVKAWLVKAELRWAVGGLRRPVLAVGIRFLGCGGAPCWLGAAVVVAVPSATHGQQCGQRQCINLRTTMPAQLTFGR